VHARSYARDGGGGGRGATQNGRGGVTAVATAGVQSWRTTKAGRQPRAPGRDRSAAAAVNAAWGDKFSSRRAVHSGV